MSQDLDRRKQDRRKEDRRKQDQAAIVALARDEAVIAGDVEHAARRITELMVERLAIDRVGIWLFDDTKRKLELLDLFARERATHSAGEVLEVEAYPRYFAALEAGRAVDAHQALDDPRTRELASYLQAHGITSMLDAPIRIGGEVIGVLCHEHRGSGRVWQADEVVFASEAADQMAQALMNQQRQVLEQRLYQAQKMESLGVLAGGIAHDFNNLLVGILGGADLALRSIPDDAPAGKHLATVHQAATRASELCNQLLAYAGKGPLELRRLDLSELVENTVPLVESSLARHAILRLELSPRLPAIEADPTQIRQVVMNLLTNASEAIGDRIGEIGLRTRTEIFTDQDFAGAFLAPERAAGHFVCLEVSDNGRGMDAATRARIFDPFFTTKGSGRGLGLAAVLGIVRGHGGAIRIDSAPERGTTIEMAFPARGAALDPPVETAAELPPPASEGLVLVVDDEEMVRDVATQMLEAGGFEVLSASDGYEGVALFREHSREIVAVLLDVAMPQMDGPETLLALRAIRGDVPVILSSGYSEQEAATRFADLDPTDFLQKPYKVQTLLEKINAALISS